MTVAKEIGLKNPLENMGAQMAREVASTAQVVGTQRDARVVGSRSARLSVRIVRVLT